MVRTSNEGSNQDPTGKQGLVTPEEFLYLAEREGFLVEVLDSPVVSPPAYISLEIVPQAIIARGLEAVQEAGVALLNRVPRSADLKDQLAPVRASARRMYLPKIESGFLEQLRGVIKALGQTKIRQLSVDSIFDAKVEGEISLDPEVQKLEAELHERKTRLRQEREGQRDDFHFVVEDRGI